MLTEFFQLFDSPVAQGLAGGVFIALCNMLGALLVLVWRRPSPKVLNFGLGLAAGVMLTASFTSLILPGIAFGGILPMLIGWALGAAVLAAADLWIPHLHMFKGREGGGSSALKVVWLFIIAITLHNMPEGLAVGISFGTGDLGIALPLMLAIGLQNIPEGFAVAISARNAGLGSTSYAAFAGIRSGLVEISLALLGAWAVAMVQPLLPYAMGFAAGAMLYVISSEIIPETHRNGQARVATAGLMLGAMLMLVLDVGLG